MDTYISSFPNGETLDETINEKMTRVVLTLTRNGNTYTLKDKDNATVNFAALYDLIDDESNYVVILYNQSKLRPQYVSANEIHCDGEDFDSDGVFFLRMLMTPTSLSYQRLDLANETDTDEMREDINNLNKDLSWLDVREKESLSELGFVNLFDGKYQKCALAALDTAVVSIDYSNINGRTAIIPIKPNTRYYINKEARSNRFRIATCDEEIKPSTTNFTTIYVGGTGSQSDTITFVSSNTAKYLAVTVSVNSEEIPLCITENFNCSGGNFVEYIKPYQDTVLYSASYPVLTFDWINHKVIIPTGTRLFYKGERVVIANSEVNMVWNNAVPNLLCYNPDTKEVYTKELTANQSHTDIVLCIFASTTPFFYGIDAERCEVISNTPTMIPSLYVNKLGNHILYNSTFPLLEFDWTNHVINIPSGTRVLFNGKRRVISNSSVQMLLQDNLINVLCFNDGTSELYTKQIEINATLDDAILCVFSPVSQYVYGVDLDQCRILPEDIRDIPENIKKEIETKTRGMSNKNKFLPDIQGVISANSNIQGGSVDDTINLRNADISVIYDIYDSLVTNYPDYVTSENLAVVSSENLPIKKYTFVKNDFRVEGALTYKKFKILLTSGIHGYEQGATWANANFLKQLCEDDVDERLRYIRENVELVVIPLCNPYGFKHNIRTNENGIDINRNFPTPGWTPYSTPGDEYYSGATANSEVETQTIVNVVDNILDVDYCIDFHNIASGNPLIYGFEDWSVPLARSLFVTLTNKWKSEYSGIPDEILGYVNKAPSRCLGDYQRSKGMLSFTIETPWRMPYVSQKEYDKNTILTSVDTIANLIVKLIQAK